MDLQEHDLENLFILFKRGCKKEAFIIKEKLKASLSWMRVKDFTCGFNILQNAARLLKIETYFLSATILSSYLFLPSPILFFLVRYLCYYAI